MNRWFIVGPLLALATIALFTWHPVEAGLSVILAGIVWEIADGLPVGAMMKEIEGFINDDERSAD